MSKVIDGRSDSFVYPDQKIHELCYVNDQQHRSLLKMEEHELVIEIGRLQHIIHKQQEALKIAQKICGQSNCNCVGASRVKAAVGKAIEEVRHV